MGRAVPVVSATEISLARRLAVYAIGVPLLASPVLAQPPLATPRDAAPVDLAGYWVSVVTEDWIERMSPDSPPSGTGFRGGTPPAPRPVSNPNEPCRVYGAAGSLRVPGRVQITWLDNSTLEIDLDAGSQRRVLHFDSAGAAPSGKTLQGYSVAAWQTGDRGRRGRAGGGTPATPPAWGSLEVVTTNMSGGYLLSSRSNYTDEAVLTEHFTYHEDFGDAYFTVTAIVDDGGTRNITSSTFKKEPSGAMFNRSGCEIKR
jgi:hypothetical protein